MFSQENLLTDKPLAGLRVLVLEDEFLIAMDVEQICRDSGAEDVSIHRNLDKISIDAIAGEAFHAAVIDIMLAGQPTYEFARMLSERKVPFIFATGYSDLDEIRRQFPDVAIVGKPFDGQALVAALAEATASSRA